MIKIINNKILTFNIINNMGGRTCFISIYVPLGTKLDDKVTSFGIYISMTNISR